MNTITRLRNYIAEPDNDLFYTQLDAKEAKAIVDVVEAAKTQVDGLIKGDMEAASAGLRSMIESLHELGERPG